MTNNTENKDNFLRGIPILLVVVFLTFAKLLHLEGWLYYIPLTIIVIINLFILYKLRKEIPQKNYILLAVTIVILIAIGFYYYYSTIE